MLVDNKAAVFAIILSLFSVAIYYVATVHGIGLTPDSVTYIKGARGILEQHNLSAIPAHYPPLYPLVLALSSIFDGDIIASARQLNGMIFVATVLLVFFIIYIRSSQDVILASLGTMIVALPVNVFGSEVMAWSEPLFYITLIAGAYLLSEYLESKRNKYLIYSALALGFAFLDRYVGIVALGAAMVAILFQNRNWIAKVKESVLFIVIAVTPNLLWMLHNLLGGHRATNREILFHPISIHSLEYGVRTMAGWFLIPHALAWLVPAILFAMLLIYAYLRVSNRLAKKGRWGLIDVLFIFSASYLIFLPISISLFDAHTPLDSRILSPAYITIMLGVVLWISEMTTMQRLQGYRRVALFLSMCVIAGIQLYGLSGYTLYAAHNGLGFAAQLWRESPMLKYVAKIPPAVAIHTNVPEPIKLYLAREAVLLPKSLDPVKRKPNQHFGAEMQELAEELAKEKAVVVYFWAGRWRYYLPSAKQLVEKYGFREFARFPDGLILVAGKVPKKTSHPAQNPAPPS